MKPHAGKSKTKRAGKERFHIIHFTNPSGEKVFRLAGYKSDGSRVRENHKTHEEAIARKAELDIEAANIITTTATRLKATRLTDEQVKDAERAYAKAGKHPLLFIVEYFNANYREPFRQITVSDAVEKFVADRKKQNRRPDTLRNLKGRLGMFVRFYGKKNVAEITTEDCRDFVFRNGTSPRNQINDRLAASNFLNWCVQRQYTTTNLMAGVDKPGVDTEEPSVLSVADCRSLLSAARDYKDGHMLPYVTLSLFAGLRPTEIARVTWDRIDLTEGTITLDGSMAKTRQRRIVKLPDNALEWLVPIAPKRQKLKPASFKRHFGRVQKAAGFGNQELEEKRQAKKYAKAVAKANKAGRPTPPEPVKANALRPWIQDYMRHTAISMYLAKHKHEGEAASWAGNSPNVIHSHYKGLVKETDATEFWSITPANVKSDVAKLPTATKAAAA